MESLLSVFYSLRCLLFPVSQKGNRCCIHSISIGDNLIQTFFKILVSFSLCIVCGARTVQTVHEIFHCSTHQ